MKDKLRELLYCAERDYDEYVDECHESGMSPMESYDEYAADYLVSKGVIVLPCKVGDEIYEIASGKIKPHKVEKIELSGGKSISIFFDWHGMGYEIASTADIGKRIFLTKQKAEQALKGGDNNDRT